MVGGRGDLGRHRLRAADEHAVAAAGGVVAGLLGQRGLPDAPRQARRRRVEFLVGAVDRVAVEHPRQRTERRQVPGLLQLPVGTEVDAEGGRDGGLAAVGHAELKPPGANRVDHGGVFRHPHHVLKRQWHYRGAQPDPRGAGGQRAEERERRRQPAGEAEAGRAAPPAELVRPHPGGIEAQFLRVAEQVERLPVDGRLVPVLAQVGVDSDSQPSPPCPRCPRHRWVGELPRRLVVADADQERGEAGAGRVVSSHESRPVLSCGGASNRARTLPKRADTLSKHANAVFQRFQAAGRPASRTATACLISRSVSARSSASRAPVTWLPRVTTPTPRSW